MNNKKILILIWRLLLLAIFVINIVVFWGIKNISMNEKIISQDYSFNLEQEEILKQSPVNFVKEEKQEEKKIKILENPPEEVRAIYLTGWSAGSSTKMDNYIDLIKKENFNAVVIDIKDATGQIFYDINLDSVDQYDAEYLKIPNLDALIEKLHQNDIYVIARIVVFEDPLVAKQRPDLAIKNKTTGGLWENYKGIEWIDPAATEYWEYIVEIAQETSARGFDEINFDYIRFPSDGPLSKMDFPFYNNQEKTKREEMKEVFEYLRSNLSEVKISVDLFGLVTINNGDLGIGQSLEDTLENFDYVCPMVYPSHYANGFIGFQNPAQHPFAVIEYSMEHALVKLESYRTMREENLEGQVLKLAKIRPWLQAFDMGAVYNSQMIKAQIEASNKSGGVGWILWNASNNYSGRVSGIND